MMQDSLIDICDHESGLPSEANTCLIWIFSLASWLTGCSVEEAEEEEEEGRVTGPWTEEDTAWTPVAEQRLNLSVVIKHCLYIF